MAPEWDEATVLIAKGVIVTTNEGSKYKLQIRWSRDSDRVKTLYYDTEQEAMRDLEQMVQRLESREDRIVLDPRE